MKKILSIISILPIVSICWQCTPPAEQEEKESLNVQLDTLDRQKGDCQSNDCIDAVIVYPDFSGTSAATKINQKIKQLIFNELVIDSAKVDQMNMQQLADELIQDYLSAKEEFKEATLNFEYNISSRITYRHPEVWSIFFNIYTYTGGAHPMTYQKFLNINPETGQRVDLKKYITNQEELKRIVEQTIRQKHDIPTEQVWSDVFFSDRFQWPENMGITQEGLILVYNPYEILPYAAGFTEIVISFGEAKQFLTIDLQSEAEEALLQ